MDIEIYKKAYRAAAKVLRDSGEIDDDRIVKDRANAIGSCAAMVANGELKVSDLKRADEPAMIAALEAAGVTTGV